MEDQGRHFGKKESRQCPYLDQFPPLILFSFKWKMTD
ncbi:hypothetical protein NC653_014207 [Populus alba x Populus x berolinensis]|uniref:Uncharacterized protein n=1 Tax=Populus alba x Populus x berolinensis TaxID=444605 RepID=A0AAD6QWN3_9ROSI|nr:hypothetical protein NC653_014207 [Populus alba x Populus x berolinensis]